MYFGDKLRLAARKTVNMFIFFKKLLRFCVSGLVVFWVFAFNGYAGPEGPELKVVEVENAGLGDITQTICLIGTVKAKRSTVLTARSSGTLDYLVHAGQKVPKGSLIARLENSELENAYTVLKDAVKIAKDRYHRLFILAKSNTASKHAVEERKNQWITAEKTLSDAKVALDKTRFTAPFNGVVGTYKILEGSQVQEGDPIVTFYDPSGIVVEFDIPAPLLSQIQDGQTVTINKKQHHISHVQKMIDPDTHMAPASVELPCENSFIGDNIDIDLCVTEHKNVIVIPYEAVFLKAGDPFVYTVEDNQAVLHPVTLGLREKDKVEITSGVEKGDLVITKGQARLYPYVNVKIFSPKQSPSKPNQK